MTTRLSSLNTLHSAQPSIAYAFALINGYPKNEGTIPFVQLLQTLFGSTLTSKNAQGFVLNVKCLRNAHSKSSGSYRPVFDASTFL